VDNNYGPFASHMGLDGTSIYAAATSGSKVIALHLLACMLARAWSGPEATAIWVELIASRKSDLETTSDPSQIHGLVARTIAQQEISRSQLAAWDASARAWLRSADEVKRFEQTQLRLIIKDSGLSLNTSGTTYSSVMEAWTMAMTSLQKLILGIPQNISKASVLLGLLSWHIYPDLNVVEPMTNIKFDDHLVNHGGVITLGLNREGSADSGVHWSLALSHLRFYGDPVAVERRIGSDNGRLTLPELRMIALGCIMSSWADCASLDLVAAADCFVALGDCLGPAESTIDDTFHLTVPWLGPMISAARALVGSTGMVRENTLGLVEFGRRRGRKLLDEGLQLSIPMFGLVNPVLSFRMSDRLIDQSVEASIAILRELAELCGLHQDDCIIRYTPDPQSSSEAQECMSSQATEEYTTAVPHDTLTVKRHRDGERVYNKIHTSWIHIGHTVDPIDQMYIELMHKSTQGNADTRDVLSTVQADFLEWLRTFRANRSSKKRKARNTTTGNPAVVLGCSCARSCCEDENDGGGTCLCKSRGVSCTSLCECVRCYTSLAQKAGCRNLRPMRSQLVGSGEHCHWLPPHDVSLEESNTLGSRILRWHSPPKAFAMRYGDLDFHNQNCWGDSSNFGPDETRAQEHLPSREDSLYAMNEMGQIKFAFLAGNEKAALFLSEKAPTLVPLRSIAQLTNLLRSGVINRERLIEYIRSLPSQGTCRATNNLSRDYNSLFFKSLTAIAAASKLYSEWPEATVSVDIAKRPLGLAHWADNLTLPASFDDDLRVQDSTPFDDYRSSKFACIAMLESGVHDFYLNQLGSVLAMASGNSIYVAESLLQDPSKPDRSNLPVFRGIRRIHGNLDRAGIVMLVPPQAPRIREPNLKSWRIVQQANFDGLPIDLFKHTSLHLSFTDFEVPIAIASGAYDPEVILLEALISVHEGRHWVADLDVLGSLASRSLTVTPGCLGNCSLPPDSDSLGKGLVAELGGQLKSIGNWEELLCCRDNLLSTETGVVRTFDNWLSRLAAAAISVKKGFTTIILPSHCLCANCSRRVLKESIWISESNGPIVLIV
jgi:hypothetical protein